jgi:hypothetical protein
MQHQQEVQQWAAQTSVSAAGSTTQVLGPFVAVLNHRIGGQLGLSGIPARHILRTLACGVSTLEVALQERVRMRRPPNSCWVAPSLVCLECSVMRGSHRAIAIHRGITALMQPLD